MGTYLLLNLLLTLMCHCHPDVPCLPPPSEGDREAFVVTTALTPPHRLRGRRSHLCARVHESVALARGQGCKLAPHLLPQLDQITPTLHPPSCPCVAPASLCLCPSILHSLSLSLSLMGVKDSYTPVT